MEECGIEARKDDEFPQASRQIFDGEYLQGLHLIDLLATSAGREIQGYTLAGTSVRAKTRTLSLLGRLMLRTDLLLSRLKE